MKIWQSIKHPQNSSFREAFTKTFDGNHPCSLCQAIQQGRAAEKKQEQKQVKTGSKLDAGVVWQSMVFNFTCDRERVPSPDMHALPRREQPPKPRPRTAGGDGLA